MTLFNALRRLPQMDVAALNFSSATVSGCLYIIS